MSSTIVIEHHVPVLVVGAGPAGLLLALQLAKNGVQSLIAERNLDSTKWPKMDITNCRSMELLRRLGIADDLRAQGVPQHYSFDVLFSTGLSENGELIDKWNLPSPDEWRQRIHSCNDGSMPREPYQRCSQAIFEAWLKRRIESEELVEDHFGLKFESCAETSDGVKSELVNTVTGERHMVTSQYLVGCDGAGSSVRRQLYIKMIGGPVPSAMYLIHFKSRDLTALHKQGQFWHIFFTSGSVIISQDEVDTWTIHLPISLDTDWKSLDPTESIYRGLGGSLAPYPIKVDEILVCSSWRPNIAIAERFASESFRVFLAGDAAHQNIPTGGYGMNTAVGDVFDLGWKLSAVLNGWGGQELLRSYEVERKPVAIRNIERSGQHFQVHQTYVKWVADGGSDVLFNREERRLLFNRIKAHTETHQGENKDHGIEMGYRYNASPVILQNEAGEGGQEPSWDPRTFVPSSWPGGRAPHVYLRDGKTSIFDLFGIGFSIIDFTQAGTWSQEFEAAAGMLNIPLTKVYLPGEIQARKVWGRDAVLVRPDDHIAWRSPLDGKRPDIRAVLEIASGRQRQTPLKKDCESSHALEGIKQHGFTSTLGNVADNRTDLLAPFQR
ncbi:FAD binding domain-containing protein [Colletotrichum abscissum]|uniref:FAD binding domain-containing protein n=1 Tax=Colletotrichum abscissum TaxID=1671311 RepID=A0A9P9XMG5_9PEZI|nr:FAD binding domain-containing protein [Colletotrichum abscissum]KAI3557051.1 FAD binding domain-containing protein [Colletotrichum abscissum]KAK1499891.1 FAD binding domain-containing protein [Colletotrichum abscissum]